MGEMFNRCAHPTCRHVKPRDRYACRTHWFSLPKKIQDMIWRAYGKDGSLGPAWQKAHQAAQDFWAKGDEDHRQKCRDCGGRIVWGVDDAGRRIPLDPEATVYESTERGTITVTKFAMVSHFATCRGPRKLKENRT